MEKESIDISGLDKAAVLRALFNAALTPAHKSYSYGQMTSQEAKLMFDAASPEKYFDYVGSRCLKVSLNKGAVWPAKYDRDNGGPGSAKRAIEGLR